MILEFKANDFDFAIGVSSVSRLCYLEESEARMIVHLLSLHPRIMLVNPTVLLLLITALADASEEVRQLTTTLCVQLSFFLFLLYIIMLIPWVIETGNKRKTGIDV